jgi:diguanylate cyclase (GGDEF)-like protein/PAS domain S-box-containing protein
MAIQRTDIDQKVEKDRIDSLYKRSTTASLTLFIICTTYAVLLASRFNWRHLLVWYFLLTAVLLGRWLTVLLYGRDQGRVKPLSYWLYIFRIGILAAGMTIGSLNLLFFPGEPLSFLLLAIIFPFGITAGAVTILVDFVSFFLYVLTLMTPVIFQTVRTGDLLYSGTGFLTFILTLFFLKFSKEYKKNFVLTTRLRYENKTLLDDLEQERNTLNNRLGRILNDSSTEIFVADAESLDCLQINQGAVDNLGYSKEEFTSINLLDIFVNLDRYSFAELLAPLYKGRSETVVHKGVNRRKDGSTYPVEARIQLSTQDIPPIIVANVLDITERTAWEGKLIHQANFDQLTGLFNRHYMQSYMHSVFTRARRNNKKVALLFMDLDNFKNVNDTLGHAAGDELLKQTASRLLTLLRESDTAARTGGDEFTVLLESLEESENAEVVACKIVSTFQQPFTIKGQEIHTSVSIGISVYPDDGATLDQLMQYADMAMYQAKENGRNNYCFFSHELRRSSEKKMQITNNLHYALARNEFSIFFQPKFDISKGRITGAEALLRWNSNELGDISPAIFVPLAENLGLMNEIGTWVLEESCREAMRWMEITDETLQISVNVSPQQFRAGILLESVEKALTESGLPCNRLELEITESLLLHDSYKPLAILKTLNSKGVSLALDDFGTGYSSLSYLKRFPLRVLKIDRSFIHDLQVSQNSKALVDAIIAMAHSLGLEIVAEGVENQEQLDFLCRRGVTTVQGYFFSRPIPAMSFRDLLLNQETIVRYPLVSLE